MLKFIHMVIDIEREMEDHLSKHIHHLYDVSFNIYAHQMCDAKE